MVENYFGIYVQALLAKNASTTLQKQLKAIETLQVKVTPTFGNINKDSVKKIVKDINSQLKEAQNTSKDLDMTPKMDTVKTEKVIQSNNKLKQSLSEIPVAANKTSQSFNTLGNFANKTLSTMDELLQSAGKVAVWGIATNAIYGTKRALEDMFKSYVEIEDKMISIQRVSEGFDMAKIFDGAYASAQKYGAGLMDMLSSVEEIARSYGNLTEQEALSAAEAGILASTVSDMDSKEAVGGIIAVSNAYGTAIENGQLLIDMANEVDNTYSVTSQGIIQAWEKSAASAKTFGVGIQDLTGYIAAISTVTQESGNVIGNSLKTIFSRITTMESAYSEIESAGVSVFDPITKESRNVSDILTDLAGKWETLSKTEKENMAVKVAGRYQQTRFLALMNQWSIATDATTTALNSEGSALKESAVYQESYTAKLEKLNNAKLKLTENLMNGDVSLFGKSLIDTETLLIDLTGSFFSVANAATFFVGTLGVLISFLTKTTNGAKLLTEALSFLMTKEKAEAVITDISTKGLVKKRLALILATKATNLKTASDLASNNAMMMQASGLRKNTILLNAKSKALAGASVGVNILSKVLAAPFTGMILVAGISLLVGALIKHNQKAKEAAQVLNEEKQALINNKQEIKDNVKELKKLLELKQKLSSEDYSKTYGDDESKLLDALAEKYKTISEELKSQNVSLTKKLELIKSIDSKTAETAKKDYENRKDTILKSGGYYTTNKNNEVTSVGKGTTVSLEEQKKAYDDLISSGQDYYRLTGDISNQENENINIIKEQGLSRAKSIKDLNDLESLLIDIQKIYAKEGGDGTKTLTASLKLLGMTEKDINKVFKENKVATDEATTSTDDYSTSIATASSELEDFNKNNEEAVDLFWGAGEGSIDALNKLNDYINVFGKGSKKTIALADELANSFTLLGTKTFKSGKELLKNKDYLTAVSGTLEIASSDSQKYAKAMSNGILYVAKGSKTAMKSIIADKVTELQAQKTTSEAKLKSMKSEMGGLLLLSNAIANLVNSESKKLETRIANNKKAANLIAGINGITLKVMNSFSESLAKTSDTSDITKNIADLDKQINTLKGYKIVETTADAFKDLGSASKTSVDYLELAQKALLKYKSAVEAVDNELKVLQEQNKQLVEGSSAWFQNIAKQEVVIARQKKAIQEYIAQVRIQMTNTKLDADQKQELANIIQDLNLDYENLNTTLTELTQTQKDYYKGEIENKLESLGDLEDKRHDKALENIESERKAFQDQIDEQLNLMKKAADARTYEQDLNKLQSERLSILTQISRLEGDNSRLSKSKVADLKDQLKDVESQISDLNYDRTNTVREESLGTLSESLDTYYDKLTTVEDKKNELILSNLETAKDSLDNLNLTITDLRNSLSSWSNILNNFGTWSNSFNGLVSTMPTTNLVTSVSPINGANNNTGGTTQITFQITGSSKDAQDIASTVVDSLMKSGLINTSNIK